MAAGQISQETAEHAARLTVGILGGTGDEGRGLACRLAMSGNRVIIGSRNSERAAAAAGALASPRVTGAVNEEAAQAADIVIVAVPFEGHAELLAQLTAALDGKIVIDCVNPIAFDAQGVPSLIDPDAAPTHLQA